MAWRAAFARPASVPVADAADLSPARIELGRRLFEDPRLSANGLLSCASCHDSKLSFADGVALGKGIAGTPLARHTPMLWNLAWGRTLFWDGRAASLEEQARGPIENPLEMGSTVTKAVAGVSSDATMRTAFAAAFPERPQVSEDNLLAALAAFERTLVSPETRFDHWVKGDDGALTSEELAGFRLFTGKAGCVSCHSGWRFTDEAFHDIGLAGEDKGRGAILGLAAADHAFKTPSLRELAWTAPYMHDGSLATLEEVVDHYVSGVRDRPTLSADLPRGLSLTAEERAQLVAFLNALSSDDPPRAASLPPTVQASAPEPGVSATTVSQKNKTFAPGSIRLVAGTGLTIVNDDTRTHNVRVDDPRLAYNSAAQEPGDKVVLTFGEPGFYTVTCGIHPQMRLTVEVSRAE
ncbi:cytochrome c peroxidase [Chelatococcus sp. SYSU_G07232]|uniref:Cytochrome c peroxidase n=1 Tax=Chelatococcus albus TaxID=3047466 RepID=A0ABT7AC49_9HYPH|nr:cytochrome c peroxidase [Chelatococcus sp. SYSU_G07232]MDJ1156948.1 cytochrome c peroxidase [Chelatococcus sp. SYSU_G07232]